MHEPEFIRKIIRPHLEKEFAARVFKIHGNAFSEVGTPDILCCIGRGPLKGTFVGLEIKMKDNKPSAMQLATIRSIQKAGGRAGVVYSHTWKEDVDKIICGKN